MPKQQLASIIQDVDAGSFHARYLKIPTADKPVGCLLPTFLDPPPDPPEVTEPSAVKDCSYNWVEEVIPLVPFVPPFPCPDGFHLDTLELDILPLPGRAAVDLISLDLRRKPDENGALDVCRYELIGTEEIVIPCYPNGPTIESTATVSVFYEKTQAQEVSRLTMNRDANYPCKWSLDGDVSVVIPEIPCPNGLNFMEGNWVIRSTCGSVPEETKRVEITKRTGFECIYDIAMPELTIPCYPDGPHVHGQSNIVITDRGTPTSTQTLGFDTPPGSTCCDFELGGDINIEIPCQTGLTIPTKTFKIISTGPSVQPDTNMELKLVKDNGNMCRYDFDFPDLEIPCYPDGPTVAGTVEVHIGRNGNNALPIQEITIGANNGATCQFDLAGDIVIPLPDFTINCDALNFHGGIRVKKNGSAPWLNNNIGLANEACGAVLSGDLNLDLPNYVVNCPTLQFGGAIAVRTYTNGVPGNALPSTVTLTRTDCGADITGEILLDIPAFNFPCPNGYTTSLSGPTIRVNGGNPINHTLRVSKVTDPQNNPGGNQCAFGLTGELNINVAGGGGQGFNYIPDWTAGQAISSGSVVGIVGHEGGRCNYYAVRNIGTNEPPPLNENTAWRCMGCEEGKRYHPFKVIKAAIPSSGDLTYVKVVVDSKLTDGKQLRTIHGLDTPFSVAPGQSIWLEVIWTDTNEPTFLYAGIARGARWDDDHNFGSGVVEPSVWNPTNGEADIVKMMAPVAFGAAWNEPAVKDYLFNEFKRWAINTNDPLNDTVFMDATPSGLLATNPLLHGIITGTLASMRALFNDGLRVPGGGRNIRSYILIAEAKELESDSGSDVVLTDVDGKNFGLVQKLKSHVSDIAGTKNNRPSRILRPVASAKNLGRLVLDLSADVAAGGGELTFSIVTNPANVPPGLTIGTKPDQVHVYYTVGTTRELNEPTYDNFKVPSVQLYDPATPVTRGMDPLHVRAIAFHPQLQASKVVVKSYTT